MALRTERLRKARERLGLTQRQLAELCGLGEQQIYRYETGRADPSSFYLTVVAEKLKVSVDYLVGLTDEPHAIVGEALRPDERKLLNAYNDHDTKTMLAILIQWLQDLPSESSPVGD